MRGAVTLGTAPACRNTGAAGNSKRARRGRGRGREPVVRDVVSFVGGNAEPHLTLPAARGRHWWPPKPEAARDGRLLSRECGRAGGSGPRAPALRARRPHPRGRAVQLVQGPLSRAWLY